MPSRERRASLCSNFNDACEKPALALVKGVDVPKGSPLADDLRVIEADALARTDDVAGARAAYERYLADHSGGSRRYEVTVKLARSLAKSTIVADQRRAVALYEELAIAVPLSDFGEEATRVLPQLREKAGIERSAADRSAFDRRAALARIEAMVERGRYAQARKAVDELIKRPGVKPLRSRVTFCMSDQVAIGLPAIETIWSPGWRPALFAGDGALAGHGAS